MRTSPPSTVTNDQGADEPGTTHHTPEQARETAAAAGCADLLLTHTSPERRERVGGATPGEVVGLTNRA